MIWVRFQMTLISLILLIIRATSKDAAYAKANDILEKFLTT